MRSILINLLACIVFAYTAVCIVLFVFQRSLIYIPQARAVSAPASTMTLLVEDASLVVSARPHDGPKAIIYFGGNAEDVSINLPSFAQAFPDHALYFLHYRGYGGSTGTASEEHNRLDALALFDKIRAQHSDIAIIGRSLGSGVAVRLASQRPASRLILITPYDSLAEIAAAQYPFFPVQWLLRDRYDSGKYAPTITTPTAIIAAENDETIPIASSKKLFNRFKTGIASMQIIPNAGHNTIFDSDQYLPAIRSAL